MLSIQNLSIHSMSSYNYSPTPTLHHFIVLNNNAVSYNRRRRGLPSCSLGIKELSDPRSALRLVEEEGFRLIENDGNYESASDKGGGEVVENGGGDDDEEEEEEEEKGISKIQVSRQKYIPVSKAELLDAIVVKLFGSRDSDIASQFLLLSS